MLTALAQEENRLAGLLSGADRYLVKPVRIPDLIEAIQAAIATSRAERERTLRGLAEEGET
jgi:DNA-binding response OmpR family regulator